MNTKIFYLLFIGFICFACACKKEKVEEVEENYPDRYSDFSRLKVGNYWIYQRFEVDADGNANPLNIFDSCYVEKDTMIGKHLFYKLVSPPTYPQYSGYNYLRDSLHYIINSWGGILFSSQEFSTVFYSEYRIDSNDTIYYAEKKMADREMVVNTPAGDFVTSSMQVAYNMFPKYDANGSVRYMNTRYAKNIGKVTETFPFYISNPKYIERRLLRYKFVR